MDLNSKELKEKKEIKSEAYRKSWSHKRKKKKEEKKEKTNFSISQNILSVSFIYKS